jgi:O-antigen ligase
MEITIAVAGLLIGAPLLVLVLMTPYWGALLVVASIPVMPFLSLGDTSASMILGVVVSLCWLMNSLMNRRLIKMPLFAPALFAYIAVVIFALLVSGAPAYDTFRMSLTYFSLLALTLLLYNTADSEDRLFRLLKVFSLSLSVLMVVSMFVYFFDHSLFVQWHPDETRLEFGSSSDNNEVALYIIALMPVQISLYRRSGTTTRLAVLLSLPLWIVSLIMIESRGAMVAAGATLLAYFVLAVKRQGIVSSRAASLLVGGLMALAMATPLLSSTYAKRLLTRSETRLILWRIALRIFRGHILFGVGAGRFADALRVSSPGLLGLLLRHVSAKLAFNFVSPHNLLLSIVVESGLVGLIMFAAFVLVTFQSGLRALQYGTSHSQVQLVRELLAGMSGFLAGAMFLTADRDRMLYVIVSAVAIAAGLARRPRVTVPSVVPLPDRAGLVSPA